MWHVEINTEPKRTAAQHVMNENENEKQRLPKITQNEVFPAAATAAAAEAAAVTAAETRSLAAQETKI